MRRYQGRWGHGARLVSAGVCLGVFVLGCVDSPPSTEPPGGIQKYIVEQAPEQMTRLDVDFDGKVTLLGVKVEPGLEVPRGKRVKLTMYWRLEKDLEDPEWKLFTHVLDGSGDRLMNIDNVGPLRQLTKNVQAWPPGRWAPGKVYVDTQSFTMPRKSKVDKVQVVAGVWKGRERLQLKSGPSAGGNRALVATLTAKGDVKDESTRVPQLEVSQLPKGASVRIDGKLDEAAWKDAASTGPFVNVKSGAPDTNAPVQGSAKLLWDDEWLYVAFDVEDKDVVGDFDKSQADPHLWTKDCVEIMIDPDPSGDNRDYYEIQINPQNLVFDSQFDEYNKPRKEPNGPFGHQQWSAKLESAVQVRGTLNDGKDEDQGYSVEARIPWSAMSKAKELPPKPGSTWRMNFYAMQNNDGVAWSPILGQGNFHKASRFGRVRWLTEGATAAAEARPAAKPEKSAAAPNAPAGLKVAKEALQQAPQRKAAPASAKASGAAEKPARAAAPKPAEPSGQ